MKKKITRVLKTMGTALEASHEGEMLTREQKKEVMVQHKERIAEKSHLREIKP